jgi:TonB-dependent starch-binding outer membrane protein SusC
MKHISMKLFLLLAFWGISSAMAQAQDVSGVVKDEKGELLPGVSVQAVGSTVGASTTIDGTFKIRVKDLNTAVLRFSFIGMQNQDVPVKGQRQIMVVMKTSSVQLEEVVAIGYGFTRKKDVTGSVSSVSAKTISSAPVASAAQAITGRMAGVQITTAEGSPDAEVRIRVRGGGSITQDNSPLYIVDGFPVNSISDVAPSDIQSIDVLKDASSTAIYGSRGANGVIIITTKSGSEGKVSVSFNMYLGQRWLAKELDVLSPYEYALWQYELTGGTGQTFDNFTKYYGAYSDLEKYKLQKGIDWQDKVFGENALTQYYNFGVTGGSKGVKYNVGLTRNAEDGIMKLTGFERNNLNIKLTVNLAKNLDFDFNSRMAYTKVDGAGTSTAGNSSNARLKHAVKYAPTSGIADISQGTNLDYLDELEGSSSLINPIDVLNDDYRQQRKMVSNYNGGLTWNIIDQLRFRTEWGIELGDQTTDIYYGSNTPQSRTNGGGLPMASINKQNSQRWRMVNTLSYDKRDILPGHNINVMVGQELNSYTYNTVTSESRFFPEGLRENTVLQNMNLGTPQPTLSYKAPAENLESYFGRLNYSYKDRYMASFTIRADGSSLFAPSNQWSVFPSGAVAWRLNDEDFMASTKDWLSTLKLRASYGEAGNNRISSGMWKLFYQTGSTKPYYINETLQNMLLPSSILGNKDLKWETTVTRNVGVDFGFFKSRINGSVEAYLNNVSNLLLAATIPANTGYTSQMQNIGKTQNKGIEFSLEGVIVDTKDFSLRASANIAFNKNKIEELGDVNSFLTSSGWIRDGNPAGDYLVQEGSPVGLMYGYVNDGMYSFDDFTFDDVNKKWVLNADVASNFAITGAQTMPGQMKYKDLNKDGKIDANNDRKVIGDANPKHTGGFNLTSTYKGFDLSVFFNWVYGNDVYNANKMEFSQFGDTRLYNNLLSLNSSDKRFTVVDKQTGEFVGTDPVRLKEVNKNATMWSPRYTITNLSSWAIEDGSFLRLNNITLGYSLPSTLLKRIKVSSLRFYATLYNVYTWTNYSGYDPEVDTRRSTPLTPNVDYSAYPRSRQYVIGLNVNF